MRRSRIGTRYAKALFELALEKNILEQVKKDMELVMKTISESKELKLFLKSPVIYPEKKSTIITAILKDHVNELSLKFVLLITKNRRETYIENIAQAFINQYKKYKNIITTILQTAVKINDDIHRQVIDLLKEQTKGEIDLIEEIKEDLIGGFVLKFDGYKYDASISKQLADLKKDFKVNLYKSKI
ncbi:MAG: ATP synthase F1 subunit delta [Bacteroidales bacterium]|nr:ATP synthase F1 subunit delta [Bacteroidales bacterium]MCF8345469.1 ATP synthase F1 subunit delta [Bacteroidales bacterium]MCF8350095.1 ATP synthase F1 subunit delta [Bacteroidales bacterium]MCF8376153.1 ATP synthase F1 subunit delta [Bacteroidales bacterium]